MTPLKCDTDILTITVRILLEGWYTLRIYIEHATSQLVLVLEADVMENVNEEDLVFHDVQEDMSTKDMVQDAEGVHVDDMGVDAEDMVQEPEVV
ncbi:hypothetical protein CJ030_MR2G013109 [Morella rubra]|uniref:Uncharacterized protein n=1 Tax=Morella rubra TaxID=262757 RepID=A0A6A1W6T1_9ROSI|nr:hypothetical protein CJ030_MR3G001907 [Morella rubra]KAB1221385.1 hypothetical protein CJ030_MR2G013109 [Morella rubra]